METYYLAVTYILAGILGLCVGSFLNVVIYRLPRGMSIRKPGSHCTTCPYVLRWYDNIPVLSYLILGGKCRGCGQRISPRYMFVELINMFLWLLCVWRFEDAGVLCLICHALICSVLLTVFFVDLENMVIPYSLQIALLIPVLVLFFAESDKSGRLFGMLLGGGLFLLVYLIGLLAYKKEVFGAGDVKLMAIAGLLLGWKNTLMSILIASVLGSVILTVIRRRRNDEKNTEYPFAPFLTASIAFSMFFGDAVVSAYLSLFL